MAGRNGISAELRAFRKLADVIGADGALLLIAFAGGRLVFIPGKPDTDHILTRLLGKEAFERLQEVYGYEGLNIPSVDLLPVRRLGRVFRLIKSGIPSYEIAETVGITTRQVQRILAHLRAGGRLFALGKDGTTAGADTPDNPAIPPARRGRSRAARAAQSDTSPPPLSAAGQLLAAQRPKAQKPALDQRLADQLRAARLAHAAKDREYAD